MSKKFVANGVVLRAFDLGEADRLYVILTESHGRIAARAGGVRKPLSRLGGHLSALARVRIECTETAAGLRLTSAQAHSGVFISAGRSPLDWCAVSEVVELLLRLTEEQTPLPGLFPVVMDYLESGDWEAHKPVVMARLLHLLGHLPVEPSDREIARLSLDSQSTLLESLADPDSHLPTPSPAVTQELSGLLERIIEPLLARPLRSRAVGLSIAAEPGWRLAV